MYEKYVKWSQKKFNGKSLNDTLRLGNFALWWYFERLMLPHTIPPRLNTYHKKSVNSLRYTLTSLLLRRALLFNEKRKIKFFEKQKLSPRPKSLLLSYTPHLTESSQVFRLQALVDELKKGGSLEPFTLFADPLSRTTYKKLKGLNTIYSFYDSDIEAKAQKKSRELYRLWKNFVYKQQFPDYHKLRYALSFFFSREFLYVTVLYYELFKKALSYNVHCCVVTGVTQLFEKCLVSACNELKVPVVAASHSIGKHAINFSSYPVTFAVVSDFFKDSMLRQGAKDVRVTGPIFYDDISNYVSPSPKTRTILIATSPFIETCKLSAPEYFKKFLDIISSLDGFDVHVKLHPRETHYDEYKKLKISGYKVYKPNVSRQKFYSLMKSCSVFMHFGTNAALEAMIIGRPVVSVDFLQGSKEFEPWLKAYGFEDYTINVNLSSNIGDAAERALKNSDEIVTRSFEVVNKLVGKVDGKSSQRLAKLLYELAGIS